MRYPIISYLIVSFAASTSAQNINTPAHFPDPNFRTMVEQLMGVRPGGKFTVEQAAAQTDEFDCRQRNIKSVQGLEFFRGIKGLGCSENRLTSLDISANTALTNLRCDSNQLTTLDLSHNPALTTLSCTGNQLTTLDLSGNPDLVYLYCGNNLLTGLDLAQNANLHYLDGSHNHLTDLAGVTVKPGWKNGDTLDIQFNDLTTEDCAEIQTLLDHLEPFNDTISQGFRYSPQNNGNLNCALTDVPGWEGY